MQEQILSSNLLENSTKTLSLTDTQLLLSTASISEEEYANILAFTQGKLAVDGLTDGTRQLSLTNLMLLKEQGLLSEATYKQVEAYLVQKNTMSKLSGAGVSLKAMFKSVGTWIGIATMAITAGIAIWNAYDQAQQKFIKIQYKRHKKVQVVLKRFIKHGTVMRHLIVLQLKKKSNLQLTMLMSS